MPSISGLRWVLGASLLVLLASCSSGGSGKKKPPSQPVAQTIAFANAGPIAKTFGDSPFANVASGGAGTGAITYSSGSTGVATVNNAGQVTIVSAGPAVITANKAADAGHLAATANYTVNVARAGQDIAFFLAGPLSRVVGDAPFTNFVNGGAGNGAITYSSSETNVATVDNAGQVTIVGAGSTVITGTKAQSANHLQAQATYTLNVAPPLASSLTAWLNATDASPVTFPATAAGAVFSRTTSGNCPSPLSAPSACTGVSSLALGTASFTDTTAGLGRVANYWLQRGATVGRPTNVTTTRFYDAPMTPVVFDDQLWIVGANDGAQIWSSNDGRAWVRRSATTPWGTRAGAQLVQFGGRFYLIAGTGPGTGSDFNDVWRSDDLLTWTRILQNGPFAARTGHQVVVHNGRMWLIGGFQSPSSLRLNDVWSSNDGVNWIQETANAAFSARRFHRVVALNGKMWLLGGGTGVSDTSLNDVWSSVDGVTWTAEAAAPFDPRMLMATFISNNRLYVVGGVSLAFNNNRWFSDVWSTADGSTWRQDLASGPYGGRSGGYLLSFRGRNWLIGGDDGLRPKNESWSTTDLVDWQFEHTSAVFSPARPGRMVSFNGKLWVLGEGMDGKFQAWSSITGDDWTQSTGAAAVGRRTFFNVATHNNRLWVQGGFRGTEPFDRDNDIWSTADGETWTRATANADFESRVGNAMFAMNGKLFVMAGYVPGSAQLADVWSSTDGATWQREIQFATPGSIYDHQVVVFNGRAWLLGGVNTNGTDGRIWSSANGIDWQLEGTQAQATGRSLLGAVVHANKIWISGGQDITFMPFNDTWSSSDGINWSQSATDSGLSRRLAQGMASFGGRLWMYGGEGEFGEDDSHDMLWSIDGTGWRHRYSNQIGAP